MTIQHDWQRDPTIPQVVEGDESIGGGSGSSNTGVVVSDQQAKELLIEMAACLKRIEYHLMLITDADLEKGAL